MWCWRLLARGERLVFSSTAAPKKSQVESCEHQHQANIYQQALPKLVSEERKIYTDYHGYHYRYVKYDSYLSTHLQYPSAMLRRFATRDCLRDNPSLCRDRLRRSKQKYGFDDRA